MNPNSGYAQFIRINTGVESTDRNARARRCVDGIGLLAGFEIMDRRDQLGSKVGTHNFFNDAGKQKMVARKRREE